MSNETGSDSFNPITMVSLRCKSCSAPLQAKATEEIIKCDYCGCSQKLVDARAFYDQILQQVNSWVREALPTGIPSVTSGMIDPVARQMVFSNSIKPRILTEYGEHKFSCFNILANPMMVLPNMVERSMTNRTQPQDIFLFQAKVQSVLPFAVDKESSSTIKEINGLSIVYGYLLNNLSLASDRKPERYLLMSQNLNSAADSIKDLEKFSGLSERLRGLAKLAQGLDLLINLRPNEALPIFMEARLALEKAHALIIKDFEMAIMVQAIQREISIADASKFLAEAISARTSSDAAAQLLSIYNFLGLLDSIQTTTNPRWQARFRDPNHHKELVKYIKDIRLAQSGQGTLSLLPSAGNILMPFWAIEMSYTFQTGALWKTQGVQVFESILVAATFIIDDAAQNGIECRHILTDIFAGRRSEGFFEDTAKRLSGKEKSISGGSIISEAISHSSSANVTGSKIVPPLCTGDDALVIVQDYVKKVCQTDRTIQEKLRLSSPRVIGLFYSGVNLEGPRSSIMPWLGNLAPRSVGNPNIIGSIVLE